ncbi:MAG: YoaP domain-containing protein [Spirochaetes bacterium]|nr:YoaP domain-containing protein [Spirochaetota bacterium]
MPENDYQIITINENNIDQEHICCAIGNDKVNQNRANMKKAWLKCRMPYGHTFKKINVRGKVFIEYVPAEQAWFPIEAKGYQLIQCFWVSGRYKGQGLGKMLYQACEEDSIKTNGLIAVTSAKKRPFLVDKKFLVKQGFTVCDTAPPYFELVVKQFDKTAPLPKFTAKAKSAKYKGHGDLVFFYSDLCPFNHDFVEILSKIAEEKNFTVEKNKITTLEQAQSLPIATGNFSLFYNGEFQTHEIMPEKKFAKFLDELKKR